MASSRGRLSFIIDPSLRQVTQWRWHLDEVFVKIAGETHYLWRAVDHEGEVLEAYVTKARDKAAALMFLRKAMKRYGNPKVIVTDGLASYGAAMREIGNEGKQRIGRYLNNQAENSHLPFRRRERAMLRFRRMRSLQKFAGMHSSVHNHFNLDRHLSSRSSFKTQRDAAILRQMVVASRAMVLSFGNGLPLAAGPPMVRGPRGGGGA